MSTTIATRQPLRWVALTRADGVTIEQARARNNSYYLVVPVGDGMWELRYASQSGNDAIATARGIDEARRAAEDHADRYDTRV